MLIVIDRCHCALHLGGTCGQFEQTASPLGSWRNSCGVVAACWRWTQAGEGENGGSPEGGRAYEGLQHLAAAARRAAGRMRDCIIWRRQSGGRPGV